MVSLKGSFVLLPYSYSDLMITIVKTKLGEPLSTCLFI
jgi:hypothetical protein